MRTLADVPAAFPPDRVAVVHGGERWTFGELDARSTAWAGALRHRGVGPDDLVAYALPNGPEFLALTFGIYRAGATPAPLSPKLPPIERDAILAAMQPRLYLGVGEVPGADRLPAAPTHHVAAAWKACTSGGSTGTPKVIVDGRSAQFDEGTDFIGIPADAVAMVPGPLYHNAPFSAAIFALWRGSAVVTMERFDADAALSIIERERVQWALMVPTMMHRIYTLPPERRAGHDLSTWQMVVHTAAPMAQWLKRAWIEWRGADHIWEVYGATEGLVRCWIGGREWLDRPGSVGRPIGGARIRVLNDAMQDVPPGTVGEIFALPASGPRSTYRYIGAERRADAGGWESVGDCGWVDDEGYLFLTDRRNDLIISGGVNIWPAEVEAALLRHRAVRSCAVIGRPDDELGQAVHAIVESAEPLTLADMTEFLRDHLVPAKWPRSIDVRTTAVRDDAGKFRKSEEATR
ncbi:MULTISPECIES: AMP-binding protein [unclassified Sphingomonas]|uniref:AMP-binding protein n=1 Tax=unclassified Sphingomonas TaxID=196159 RepID=UPI0009E83EDD|nr:MULTISPECIES: AMP-binding protein [unclassified Sphingomonas]